MTPRIAIIGDRGIPARYSGFSTLVEELATRLVRDHGMDVAVYCRRHYYDERPSHYEGVRCVYLPAPGGKSFESIVHSNLSILHASIKGYDLAFVVDPGNAPFIVPLLLRGVPTVMHTDGMGWKRSKWSPIQRSYYKWSERVCARLSTWLATDSRAMARYYRDEYCTDSTFIPYGHASGAEASDEGMERFGIEPGRYLLVVARMEPENNVRLIVREYGRSECDLPLVVVGGARYGGSYVDAVRCGATEGVHFVGTIWDSAILNGLYKNCYLYIHGHEVGGTNPSLLRAMGAGAACLPINVPFHREVLSDRNTYFEKDPGDLAARIDQLADNPDQVRTMAELARHRATTLYRWDAVAAGYARLFEEIIQARRAGERFLPGSGFEPYCPLEFVDNEADPAGQARVETGAALRHASLAEIPEKQ